MSFHDEHEPAILQGEELISLVEAAKLLPAVNGKGRSFSTVWRWCRRGILGVRLEHICIGRNIVTSRQAMNRFFVVLAEEGVAAWQSR